MVRNAEKGLGFNLRLFFFIVFLLLLPAILSAQHHSSHEGSVGKISFTVSTSEAGQNQFNHALAMLHHMMYDHAEKEFKALAETDPNCSMAYWGIAMSAFHPLWHAPTKEDLKKGFEAVEKAKSLNPPSKREQDYIKAIEAIYKDWEKTEYPSRLANWVTAQENLFKTYPEDIDAGAFYALSLLASAPKEDKTFSNQKKAGMLLEELHAKAPEHPGLFHYIIHAYDNPVLAERAVDVARAYDKLAPDVAHALHMPSHIFVRLGLWSDAIDWNIRSAASAKKNSLNNVTSLHYPHALDYLMYSYLQKCEDQKAKETLAKVNAPENYEDNLASAYGIAASQARFVLERKQWKEASELPLRTHTEFAWDKYPFAEAITYFARGLGAARIDNTSAAKNSVKKLDELYENTLTLKQNYWAILVDAQRIAVNAWIAFSEGNKEEALRLMEKAADIEDSVDKHPVTPGAVLPARELLGDMLVLLEKPADALKAYDMSLKVSPNRFYSVYGAGYAAQLAGDLDKAKSYYASLKKLTSEADTERTEISRMNNFLTGVDFEE
jgi:hypothetical protein